MGNSSTVPLVAVLGIPTGEARVTLDAEALRAALAPFNIDQHHFRFIQDELSASASVDPHSILLKGWSIDLPVVVLQSALTAALLAALVADVGVDSPAVLILAAIIPFLVDVKRISVRESDKRILAVLQPAIGDHQSVAEWYEKLPGDLKEEITQVEFLDFLERLSEAGLLSWDDCDGVTVLELPY